MINVQNTLFANNKYSETHVLHYDIQEGLAACKMFARGVAVICSTLVFVKLPKNGEPKLKHELHLQILFNSDKVLTIYVNNH